MNVREKTHQSVLHQQTALESMSADKVRVATKRGIDAQAPGVQHGRDETEQRSASREQSRRQGNLATVFVLDKRHNPLDPTTPKRARELLKKGRARVHRYAPFTIRITDRKLEDSTVHPHTIGIDPGSKYTGIAVSREEDVVIQETGELQTQRTAVHLVELEHRGWSISKNMESRASLRRGRRSRNLRYRAPRFLNRTKHKGWLPPSLQHRVLTTMTQVNRLIKSVPVSKITFEYTRFDTQKLQNPEIQGTEYQRGTLQGSEIREYLLAKYNHQCVYCNAQDTPLNLDHVVPRSRGGSNRVSNLVLACIPCNQRKSNRPLEDFLKDNPTLLRKIKDTLKRPLKDAAATQSTRNALLRELHSTGLPFEATTGGHTKFTRTRLNIPKEHCLDALCTGTLDTIQAYPNQVHYLKSMGRGSHQRTRVNRFGFPVSYLTRQKSHFGFQTGDLTRATPPTGKHQGTHTGRVAVRKTGSFNIKTQGDTLQGINHKHFTLLQRSDGYTHQTDLLPPLKGQVSGSVK